MANRDLSDEERLMIEKRLKARQAMTESAPTFNPVGSGFSYGPDAPVPASRTGSETIVGDIATGASQVFAPLAAHSQRVGGMQAPQAPDQSAEFNPFNGKFDVNPEQFLTAEEAQAKQESEKFAGMSFDQMQMAKGLERTQLADNAQTAPTMSPAAPTQPNSFATSQGAATTVGGQDLGEYLRGGQAPVEGQQTPSMTPQAPVAQGQAPVSSFEQASLDREARIEQNFGNGQAVSDRERRGTGEMSMADAVSLAGGDRKKARAMVVESRKGESGVSAKERAETAKIQAETMDIISQIGNKGTELNLSPAELARDKAAGATLNKWDDSGRSTITSNIGALEEVIGGLESGQIKTRGFVDALPFAADWARAIVNPTGQDAKDRVQGVIFQTLRETLGAQFTEKEGQRLVEASYNVKLSPEQNAERLRDYTNGLKRAAEARESQMRYLKENKTLSGYEGPSPSDIMSRVGSGGANGSPIKGDVNIAGEADKILSSL